MTANLRLLSAVLSDASTLSSSAATNLLLESRTFGTSPWSGAASVAPGTGGIPAITDSSNSVTQERSQTITVPNNTATYTLTFAFPSWQTTPGPSVRVSFTLTGGTSRGGSIVFDKWAANTYRQVTDLGGLTVSTAIAPTCYGGNYVITMTVANNGSGNTSLTVLINPAYGANQSYTNDVTQMGTFELSWMQVEASAYSSGYIATTTTTAAGGDFLAALPVNNLRLEGRGRVARRASNIGGVIIKGDILDAAGLQSATLSAMVLHRHNLDSGTGLRLELFGNASQTGVTRYDSGIVDANGTLGWNSFGWFGSVAVPTYSVMWFASTANVYSFRLTIIPRYATNGDLSAVSATAHQIKRFMLGAYVEPAVNAAYGLKLGWRDSSIQRRTQGGSIRTDARAKYRALSGVFDAMVEADRAAWTSAQFSTALRNEVFVSVFPAATDATVRDYSFLGKFTDLPPNVVDRPTTVASGFVVEEV